MICFSSEIINYYYLGHNYETGFAKMNEVIKILVLLVILLLLSSK